MSKNFELSKSSVQRELSFGLRSRIDVPIARNSPPEVPEQRDWERALNAVRRHWHWALGFASLFSLTVALVVFLMRPVYAPTAWIQVDPPGDESFSLTPGSPIDSAEYAETHAKILQTDELAMAVIRKLKLDQNPEFMNSSAFESTPNEAGADPSTAISNGSQLEMTQSENRALRIFKHSLNVQRDSASWLISVSFAAHDPQLAAQITNTVVDQFIEMDHETRHDAIVQSTKWLSRQLDDIRSRMDQSNHALAEFQKTSGIIPVNNAESTFDERISDLNKQVTAAQADRIQLEALLQKLNGAGGEAVPQSNADPVVQELSKRLASARSDLRQALVIYGANHPKTKEIHAQIAELESQLHNEENTIYSNLKTNYAAARARESLLASQLKDAGKAMGLAVQYETLRKEALVNEGLYNALYSKVKEAGIAAESKSSNVTCVDRARILDRPTRPNRPLDIFIGIFAGLIGGVVLACVRGAVDSKIHTLEDIKDLTGVLGGSMVPLICTVNGKVLRQPRKIAARKNGNNAPSVFLLERPNSAESEALLALDTSVRLSRPSHTQQVLLVASSVASEGKSTIAANLSVALARHGSTCLVDADLRKQHVGSIFGMDLQQGLSDVLHGYATLEEVLVNVPDTPNLTLLPAGPMRERVGELVCSERMRELLDQLRRQFQFIVVDSPPILPFADARAMSTFVDGVIFVGRSGVTTREVMRRSLELLHQAQSAPLVDVVLNAVDFTAGEYRHYYYQYKAS